MKLSIHRVVLLLLLVATPSSLLHSHSSIFVDAQTTTAVSPIDTTLAPRPTEYGYGPGQVLGLNQAIAICSPSSGPRICYTNWFGHFYFDCNSTASINVRIWKCNVSDCADPNCVVVSTLPPLASEVSVFEGNKKYTWTGALHNLYAGYVSVEYYRNDNASERNCSSYNGSTMLARYHWPAAASSGDGPCLRWVELPQPVDRASRRWTCSVNSSAGTEQVERSDFLYAWDCSGISRATVRNTSECYEASQVRWRCGNTSAGEALRLAVFHRGLSAGKAHFTAVFVSMITFAIMCLVSSI